MSEAAGSLQQARLGDTVMAFRFEKLPKDINQRPQVGWVPKSESASEICVTAFSSTGACETLNSVEGRLEATERVSLW